MSSPVNPLLTTIPTQMTIYLGIFTLVAGVIGGTLNIIVFLSLKTFRQSSCALFLLVMSLVNIGQLLTSLLSRIMITGFEANWIDADVTLCKIRIYCLHTCTLISYTCMCLATIDQYLATSLHPYWRDFINLKRAHILYLLVIIFWMLHGIPVLIYYTSIQSFPTNTFICTATNSLYQRYVRFGYTLTFTGILPITVTVLFGSLAYRNVRQIPYRTIPLVRRELDKQLTSMVLVQVLYSFFVITPYVIVLIILYVYAASPNVQSPGELRFANFITGMVYYFYFASPFYIYLCVSKRFRQQLVYVLVGIYLKHRPPQEIGINQIRPQIKRTTST